MSAISRKNPSALAPTKSVETPSRLIVETEGLFDRAREISQYIAQRAYEFFESRGRQVGYDIEDWLRAELELLRPVPVDISETDDKLIVRAELPGFRLEEIKVSVEPRRVIISGKIEEKDEPKAEKTISSERQSDELFRSLDLPVSVDPASATATLQNGILELSISKATTIEPVEVAVKAI